MIFVDSKALKWAHSRLSNHFSNAAIGQKQPIENRIRDRAKYNQVLTALFDKTAFTVTERQLVLLSISRFRNCSYCLAAHGTVAKKQKISTEIVHAVYYNQPLEDTKLEALRTFTREVLEAEGWVKQDALQAFYQAGYQKQHVLEVVLGISFKILSNYVNHINDTPIDAMFLSGIPDSENAVTV